MKIRELWHCLMADMVVNKVDTRSRSFLGKTKGLLYLLWFSPNFSCVFWFRINQYLARKQNKFMQYCARRLSVKRVYKFSNDLSMWADIGYGLKLVHISNIVIGRRTVAGKNLTLLNGVTLGEKNISDHGMPRIGDNVYIGTGAKLLGGITIGNNVVIGALTFCDKSIPANSVAYGNPMIVREKPMDR